MWHLTTTWRKEFGPEIDSANLHIKFFSVVLILIIHSQKTCETRYAYGRDHRQHYIMWILVRKCSAKEWEIKVTNRRLESKGTHLLHWFRHSVLTVCISNSGLKVWLHSKYHTHNWPSQAHRDMMCSFFKLDRKLTYHG